MLTEPSVADFTLATMLYLPSILVCCSTLLFVYMCYISSSYFYSEEDYADMQTI